MKNKNQAQQGDVTIEKISSLPKNLKVKEINSLFGGYVLAYGESTGHAHVIEDTDNAALYEDANGTLYLSVKTDVKLKHQEHKAQTIVPGDYIIRPTKEYDYIDEMVRRLRD